MFNAWLLYIDTLGMHSKYVLYTLERQWNIFVGFHCLLRQLKCLSMVITSNLQNSTSEAEVIFAVGLHIRICLNKNMLLLQCMSLLFYFCYYIISIPNHWYRGTLEEGGVGD